MESSGFATLVHCVLACFFISNIAGDTSVSQPFDASQVTWAHAINSKSDLKKELEGSVDLIEADVTLGHLPGNENDPPIPVMAHSPVVTVSDLSLDIFMKTVVSGNGTDKGIKLDFKLLEAVEMSLQLLKEYEEKLVNTTLWLNADILPGPVQAKGTPVNATQFLSLCRQYFPNAIVSIGWTTDWSAPYPPYSWRYEWDHVRNMADAIKCFGYDKKFPSFTFPVRGLFASRSVSQFRWLLGVVPGSTLTIWSGKEDPLRVKDLMEFRESFAPNQVYYDVPEPIHSQFMQAINDTPLIVDEHLPVDKWTKVNRGPQKPTCMSQTYIGGNSIVFGMSLQTAVMHKKLTTLDDGNGVKAKGKLRFFGRSNSSEVTIVIVDVSLLAKNASEAADMSGSDTHVLWKAINSSRVHTFVDEGERCRIFQLDSSEERSFQAWKVPCDDALDRDSFEDVIAIGVPEVPWNKKLVFPASPFMIGFVSSGESPAVVYDIEISELRGGSASSIRSMPMLEVIIGTLIFLHFILCRKI